MAVYLVFSFAWSVGERFLDDIVGELSQNCHCESSVSGCRFGLLTVAYMKRFTAVRLTHSLELDFQERFLDDIVGELSRNCRCKSNVSRCRRHDIRQSKVTRSEQNSFCIKQSTGMMLLLQDGLKSF